MGFLSTLLGTLSGSNTLKVSEQLLFDKVIGFKSVVPGCGASTVLQNVAIALSENTKFNICVLDTNFMYPIQYPLLASTELKNKDPDVLDFAGDLSKITRNTSYANVYVAQLENRSIIDMLSGKDTEDNITKLIASLKSYFDVILIDLSYEMTNTAIYSAIKCNKIFLVADTSLKSLYYIKKAINTLVTLGIPLAKCNKVVLNKDLPDVVLGVKSALEEADLEIVGTIPLSMDIAISCASGKKLYGALSKDTGVTSFNIAIDNILKDILENNPLNSTYIDTAKELARMESEQEKKKAQAKGENLVVEEEVDEENDSEMIIPEDIINESGEVANTEIEEQELPSVNLEKEGEAK